MFTVARKLFNKRILVLLTLVALSVVLGKCGFPGLGKGIWYGFWDGPVGG